MSLQFDEIFDKKFQNYNFVFLLNFPPKTCSDIQYKKIRHVKGNQKSFIISLGGLKITQNAVYNPKSRSGFDGLEFFRTV